MSTPVNESPSVSSLDPNGGNAAFPSLTTLHQQQMSNDDRGKNLLLENLVKIMSLPPTKGSLIHLAGMISTNVQILLSSISPNVPPNSADTSALGIMNHNLIIAYLRAATQQLRVVVNIQPSTATPSAVALETTSSSDMFQQQYQQQPTAAGNNNSDRDTNIETYTRTILMVINMCVSQLSSDNEVTMISDTGILEALWYLAEYYDMNRITSYSCEFLQACILGKRYQYAYDRIAHSWPIPTNTNNFRIPACSVELVLRYYYLRGIVCMSCKNQKNDDLAIRCFWTCLSIPTSTDANAVSAIAIAAYKKLILLQALSPLGILHTTMIHINTDGRSTNVEDNNTNDNSSTSVILSTSTTTTPTITIPSATNPFSTPKEMSWDLVRFIAHAKPPTIVSSSMENSSSTSPTTNKNRYFYPHLGINVYKHLIQSFIMVDRIKFNMIIHEYDDLFIMDGNYGCVCRLSNALYYRQVYVISRIYASIPLNTLCHEMNSLPINDVRLLLHNLQVKLSWPIQVVTKKSQNKPEEDEVVIFPSDLPRPVIFDENTQTQQLMELSQTVQQLNTVMESSTKYKTAVTYYNRQTKNMRGTSKAAASVVMEESFSNY